MSNENFAVLKCKFKDDTSDPRDSNNNVRDDKFYLMLFTHVGAGTLNMPLYFRDISHNHVDISQSEVMGWFVMDKNVSDYDGYGGAEPGRTNLINWAKDAATAGGKDLTPYGNRIVVCLNCGLETYGGGSGAVLDNWGLEPSVAGQEMLHTFGLDHSRQLGQGDYTDPYDIMSTWTNVQVTSDPLYGRVGPIICAANMDHLGWLDHARLWQATGELKPTSISLRPLARPDLQGYIAAKIGDYYIEFRTKESWDAGIDAPCVLVHTFGADNHSYLIPGESGKLALSKGDRFRTSPVAPVVTTIKVVDIDPIGRSATIEASQVSQIAHIAHR